MTHRKRNSPQKRILAKCLLATLAIHIAIFFFFYRFPPRMPMAWHTMFISALPNLKMVPKVEEEMILEEFFDPFPELSTLSIQAYDRSLPHLQNNSILPESEETAPLVPSGIDEKGLVMASDPALPNFSHYLSLRPHSEAEHALVLPDTLSLPSATLHCQLSDALTSFPPMLDLDVEETTEAPTFAAVPEAFQAAPKRLAELPKFAAPASSFRGAKETLPQPASPPVPHLEESVQGEFTAEARSAPLLLAVEDYALPEMRYNETPGELFDTTVRLTKAGKSKGYLFTITLKPKKQANLNSMQHNYTFLLDRTNSIEKHHFTSFKKATLRALSKLQPEDNFNIVVFDRKPVYFSKEPVPYSEEAKEAAEKFLNKQKNGGLFAAADLYQTLPKILPELGSEEEIDTLILLTDGTSDAKTKKQQKAILEFLDKINPQATLYTAAVGHQNDLKLLEMIGRCSGGGLLHSDTYAAFPRRLAGLVYRLRNPIAKELKVSAIGQNPKSEIKLYSPSSTVFYSGQPLEIVGKTEELQEFTLVIEGVYEGEPLRIKKKISFDGAKNDTAYVKKLWGAERNLAKYDEFLDKGRAGIKETLPSRRR